METEDSFLYAQKPDIGLYSKSDESGSHDSNLFV
jgi:hypothetical protein